MRLALLLVLALGCGKPSEKVTREQCSKVADHIADLIIDHYATHPDAFWDVLTAEPGDTGVPKTVTKETFKAFLDSPEGKTWLMQRHGQARSGTEAGILCDGYSRQECQPCVEKATPKLVKCLLAAKSPDDVTACDKTGGDSSTKPK